MSGKKHYRLLMIDDDASLNQLLTEYFERFGHTLATATTASTGRYLLRRDDPDLLILDDFALQPLTHEQRTDLLEIMEDRHGVRSTIVTSQLPVRNWHKAIADPTLADAILDRLVHNAHKLELKGESMRKNDAVSTNDQECPA